MTTPQEEAERRYSVQKGDELETNAVWGLMLAQGAFVAGAEWQSERLGPLVEAARAYREAELRASNFRLGEDAFAIAEAIHLGKQRIIELAAALDEEGGE